MDLDQRLLIAPCAGAAIALALGLSLGGAMQPELSFGRIGGPQMLSGLSGERAPGPMDTGASFVSYSGRVPDYVIGTDVARALEPQVARQQPVEVIREDVPIDTPRYQAPAADAHAEPVSTTTLTTSQDEDPAYPSMVGGQFYVTAPRTAMDGDAASAAPDAS